MSLTARDENAKTVAALMGLDEDEAAKLLEMAVSVRAGSDRSAQCVRRHVVELLRRTAATVTGHDGMTACTVEVLIGNEAPRSKGPIVHVGVTDEEVVISCESRPGHTELASVHEIVLLIAACYAAGMAVRIGLGGASSLPHHDTIRLPVAAILGGTRNRPEAPARLGRLYLAGAGAVGNGFLWALSTFDVQGELHIVDPKGVSSGNLGRCLWFEDDDVDRPKAECLAARAQAHLRGLTLIPRVATIQNLPERTGGAWLERVVVGVDSRRARRRLQEELPRDVFDASTTGVEEVVLHFNSALEPGACLSCIYHDDPVEAAHEAHVASVLGVEVNDVQRHYVSEDAAARIVSRHPQLVATNLVGRAYDTLFKALCGAGQLGVDEGRTVLAPLAFVSVLAGAYLALELVSRSETNEVARPFNYWRASPWTSPVLELRTMRPPRDGCETCSAEVIRATVRSLWGTSGTRSR